MPHFRQDPITGQWVSIAPERAARPADYADPMLAGREDGCPFCEGNEGQTPEEVMAVRPSGGGQNAPGWNVRVVANKYPFVCPSAPSIEHADDDNAFTHAVSGQGVHEVIVESPRHVARVTELSDEQFTDVLRVYRDRLGQLRASQQWPYALIFKNSGQLAGASLAHIHSQLIALPMVPQRVQQSNDRAQRYFREHGRTLWSEVIRRECEAGQRLVSQTDHFIAMCPYASRQPYELLVLPKRQAAHFSELAETALSELAALLRGLIARLEAVLDPLAFNWMLNTCPFDTIAQEHYHWQVEIVPRATPTAGYEWASGYAVNAVSPEDAARRLRDAR